MSNAQLFVDAIHTANALAHAVFWGLVFAAALCVVVVPAVIGGVVWGVDAARSRLDRSETPEQAVPVPEPHPRRRVPAWACEQPLGDGKYEHAA